MQEIFEQRVVQVGHTCLVFGIRAGTFLGRKFQFFHTFVVFRRSTVDHTLLETDNFLVLAVGHIQELSFWFCLNLFLSFALLVSARIVRLLGEDLSQLRKFTR